ncbi:MAG: sulfotransferase family protein [Alphaproteobacteria bacterium]|nr:MAG: sulfotransferase family protein [Alphaproteobacteria bacterium]
MASPLRMKTRPMPPAARGMKSSVPEDARRILQEGMVLEKAGRKDEAAQRYYAVLKKYPDQPDANYLMGLVAARSNDLDVAIGCFEKAVKGRPNAADFLVKLGRAFLEANMYFEAEEQLLKAVRLAPKDPEGLTVLGDVYRKSDRPEKAEVFYQRAMAIRKDFPRAFTGLAHVKMAQGEHDIAIAMFRDSIARNLRVPQSWRGYAMGQKFSGDVSEIDTVEALLDKYDGKSQAKARVSLHWAAGKMANDIGQYDRAFRHYVIAKETDYDDYDLSAYADKVAFLKELFTAEFFAERADFGNDSSRPVFIFGMPRSGTTLTEQIIASHPKVHAGGEVVFFNKATDVLGYRSGNMDEFARNVSDLDAKRAGAIAREYLDYLKKFSTTAPHVTDKMPHNFERLWLIALLFPKATYIHCTRNPIDNCVSIFTNPFNQAHAYSRTLEDVGGYYRLYKELSDHFCNIVPVDVLESRYEELVADQEARSRALIAHAGLEWDDASLRFYEHATSVRTLSHWQVRQPVYKTSVERWRRYGANLDPLIRALGDLAPADAVAGKNSDASAADDAVGKSG